MPDIDDDGRLDGEDDDQGDDLESIIASARKLLAGMPQLTPDLSWEEREAVYDAQRALRKAEEEAAEAKRRAVRYSAAAPVADTPEAVIGAIGRTIGRCEDLLEEVLYFGKYGPNDTRLAAIKMMPGFALSVAHLGGAVLRWNARAQAALADRRDEPAGGDVSR